MKIVRPSKALLGNVADAIEILHSHLKDCREYTELVPLLSTAEEAMDSETLDRLINLLNEGLVTLMSKGGHKSCQIYANKVAKIDTEIKKLLRKAEYDFFRQCGKCGKCCISPYIFSFEKKFIEEHFDKLEEDGGFYHVKQAGKKCIFYNKKEQRCSIYENRPMDCKLFPFSFMLKKIEAEGIDVSPKNFVFLLKAKGCLVSAMLSQQDLLDAMSLTSSILSKIDMEEAYYYSTQVDPKRMEFAFSVPYMDVKRYETKHKNMVGSYSRQ